MKITDKIKGLLRLTGPLTLLALPAPVKAKPTMHKISMALPVPVGHVMATGNAITIPFKVTVEAGIRWHPDWTEPRVAVAAFRFFPAGDALVWTGDSAAMLPLPLKIAALTAFHGQPVNAASKAMLDELGLTPPSSPEPLAAFIAEPFRGPITIQ